MNRILLYSIYAYCTYEPAAAASVHHSHSKHANLNLNLNIVIRSVLQRNPNKFIFLYIIHEMIVDRACMDGAGARERERKRGR